MFYDLFKALCDKKGVSVSRACLDMGLSRSIAAKWKNTKTNPSAEVLPKIANYFGVTVDYLLTGEQKENAPALTKKDERDIARDLERIMNDLENRGDLMFDGVPMTQESIDSLRSAMKLGLEAVKLRNKETYTPKKYRGTKESK